MMQNLRIDIIAGVVLPLMLAISSYPAFADFERDTIQLKASEVAPEDLLSGEYYRLEEQVTNVGFMNNYRINSDFGEFSASSNFMLRTRVREIEAIAELQQISKTEAFIEAVGNTAKKPIVAIEKVVTNPVGTVKGLPQGINRFLKRGFRIASDAKKSIEMSIQNSESEENFDEIEKDEESSSDLMTGAKDYTTNKLGYNRAIREISKKLGVDPYSTNVVLQENMESVAWAMAAGSLAIGSVMSIPSEVRTLGDINDLVWNSDPIDLQIRNEQILESFGLDESAIEMFFANPNLSTTVRTWLISSLELMGDIPGRNVIIIEASEAESEQEAVLYAQVSEFLLSYHLHKSPLKEILYTSIFPVGETVDNKIVLVSPLDYVAWTERADQVAQKATVDIAEYFPGYTLEFHLQGKLSDLARNMLAQLGWSVYENSEALL